jgi:proteic killer suppression protein
MRYYWPVILSFADAETQALAEGNPIRRFASFERVARRKLRQLEIAGRLEDLRIPPGNHLEKLKGDREGQMSIRINNKWRLCFTWTTSGARDVEIVDYH